MSQFNQIKYIAFDLDGTLVDSVPDLAEALRMMLAELGKESVSDAEVRNWIGNGVEIMVKRALSRSIIIDPELDNEQYLIARVRFDEHYQNNGAGKTEIYPSVPQTLAALKKAGFTLGIVTNKPEQFIPDILAELKLAEYFTDIIGGDTLVTNKPSPEGLQFLQEQHQLTKQNMLMVGDSKNDILAAQNAAIASVGLTYGYNYGEPIANSNPDAVLDNFSDLLPLLGIAPSN